MKFRSFNHFIWHATSSNFAVIFVQNVYAEVGHTLVHFVGIGGIAEQISGQDCSCYPTYYNIYVYPVYTSVFNGAAGLGAPASN